MRKILENSLRYLFQPSSFCNRIFWPSLILYRAAKGRFCPSFSGTFWRTFNIIKSLINTYRTVVLNICQYRIFQTKTSKSRNRNFSDFFLLKIFKRICPSNTTRSFSSLAILIRVKETSHEIYTFYCVHCPHNAANQCWNFETIYEYRGNASGRELGNSLKKRSD
jgi:hypothetical protein